MDYTERLRRESAYWSIEVRVNQYVGRADWLQTAKNTIYGRYYVADHYNSGVFTDSILTTTRSRLDDRAQAMVVAVEFIISPTLANSIHARLSRLMKNPQPACLLQTV